MKTSRFLLRGFRRPREIACFALGKLERQVMEEIWRLGEVSVRDIYKIFEERIAYTTLMTTLDRLFKKGLLDRRKADRAFLYSPRLSRPEWDRQRAGELIAAFLAAPQTSNELLISCLVDAVGGQDESLLDELERKIHLRRQQLSRKAPA